MKRTSVVLLLAMCITSALALAQYGGPNHRRQMPSVDDQVNRLSGALSLSDDQKTQVRPILQHQQDQMKALMQDTSVPREDRRSKMMAIHQATSEQIRGLLNEDQKKKYDALEKERQQQMQHHGSDNH